MLESKHQTDVINFLKGKGCFVMKITPVPGIPKGTADVFFCKEGFYGFIECKAAKDSTKQPGQEQFIKKMDGWSYGKFSYPEIWPEIKKELESIL